jgi:hypothetical protein
MTARLQVVCRQLLWGCMACAPWWGLAQAQAQTLEALMQDCKQTLVPNKRSSLSLAI